MKALDLRKIISVENIYFILIHLRIIVYVAT